MENSGACGRIHNSTPFSLTLRHFRWHWGVKIRITILKSMQYVAFLWDFGQITSNDQTPTTIFRTMIFLNIKFIKFHGIPWNFKKVSWNSMELGSMEIVIWNSMELEKRQFCWHEQFHGIPWNLRCANFDDPSSSMEFHGTWSAPISRTRAVPWNSMEPGVHQFRWHEQFHGIPCMEFHITWSAAISMTRAAPWNSMELVLRHFRWHEQFHGTPWNYMDFHGTWGAPISMTRAVPWNSMEIRGTLSAPILMTRSVPWNSMELVVRQFRWHGQFHGSRWNLKCANFADSSSSMEFHGTWNAPISLTPAVLWNSMELGVRKFRWHEEFHGIPWKNCMEFVLR